MRGSILVTNCYHKKFLQIVQVIYY
uniref:Uncharacterized protein n=1 Tax=Arundo donax TaxID=35708 RepID=A0A0A9B239_ARUDO